MNLYRALAGHPDLHALAFERLLNAEARSGRAGTPRP
jgi:hypothetical protein